jgi:small-conductance mechanosensitive channel
MIGPAEIVETKELVQTVIYALVAGIGVTLIYSVAIWGVARFVDLSQEDRRLAAGAAALTAALALLAVVAIIVVGVVVMTSK